MREDSLQSLSNGSKTHSAENTKDRPLPPTSRACGNGGGGLLGAESLAVESTGSSGHISGPRASSKDPLRGLLSYEDVTYVAGVMGMSWTPTGGSYLAGAEVRGEVTRVLT